MTIRNVNVANAFIHRAYVDAESIATGVSSEVDYYTFTAARPVLVVGWFLHSRLYKTSGPTAAMERLIGSIYVTRDKQCCTMWDYQSSRSELSVILNVAATDIVDLLNIQGPPLDRWFTDKEAENMGLLLGYGESLHFAVGCEVKVAGNGSNIIKGYMYYKEV